MNAIDSEIRYSFASLCLFFTLRIIICAINCALSAAVSSCSKNFCDCIRSAHQTSSRIFVFRRESEAAGFSSVWYVYYSFTIRADRFNILRFPRLSARRSKTRNNRIVNSRCYFLFMFFLPINCQSGRQPLARTFVWLILALGTGFCKLAIIPNQMRD